MAATITGTKRAFLESQVRVLTAPLELPAAETWRVSSSSSGSGGGARRRGAAAASGRHGSEEDADDLPDRMVEEALRHVNDRLRRHNAAAFPPAALAHVAAQIDALREHDASRAFPHAGNNDAVAAAGDGRLSTSLHPGVRADGAIERGAPLGADAVVDALPETWPEGDDDTARAKKQKQKASSAAAGRPSTLETFAGGQDYGAKVRHLRELQARRTQARQRLAQLRQLEHLLVPLRDPARAVQPNLVGRDGDVGRELERMRVLLQRAAERVGSL